MDTATAQALREPLLTAATALAGLILVFLGGTLNAFEAYDAVSKKAVRPKFRVRALLGLGGFLAAVFSSGTAVIAFLGEASCWITGGLVFLALSAALVIVAAIDAVMEIGWR